MPLIHILNSSATTNDLVINAAMDLMINSDYERKTNKTSVHLSVFLIQIQVPQFSP